MRKYTNVEFSRRTQDEIVSIFMKMNPIYLKKGTEIWFCESMFKYSSYQSVTFSLFV